MKINQEYDAPLESTGAARPRWVENPNPEFEPLWVKVKNILIFFLVIHSMVVLLSLTLGLKHPLTLLYLLMGLVIPALVLGSSYIQSKRSEPDDLYLSNLGTFVLRLFLYFGANIALIVSLGLGVFPFIFSALLISCIVIELLAYLTYRSYSDDMIREIIEERKMLSPVNENNEFWFLSRGGDVGSERLLIKGKWHLRLLYAVAYITPFVFISGGKINSAFILTFITIAVYFICHGVFTGYYVTRRGLQMRLEGKL